jgi:hypothetical protein
MNKIHGIGLIVVALFLFNCAVVPVYSAQNQAKQEYKITLRTEPREGLTRKHISPQRHRREWEASLRRPCENYTRHASNAGDEHGGNESYTNRCLEWL